MATEQSVTLDINGMTCASCVRRVERALHLIEAKELADRPVGFAALHHLDDVGAKVALHHEPVEAAQGLLDAQG